MHRGGHRRADRAHVRASGLRGGRSPRRARGRRRVGADPVCERGRSVGARRPAGSSAPDPRGSFVPAASALCSLRRVHRARGDGGGEPVRGGVRAVVPLADGTEAVRFTPEELVERLAALVPPPRAHLVSYHGVLAGRSAWRSEVVPDPPVTVAAVDESALTPSGRVRRRYYRTWASSVWRETRFVYRTRPVRNVGLRQAHRSEG